MSNTDTDALVPVAWQFGARFLGTKEAAQMAVRLPVAFRHWAIPLYGPDTIERLQRERDEAVARERERCARLCEAQLFRSDKIATPEDCADAIRTTKAPT